MIRHNGMVFPCCHIRAVPENSIGNINHQHLSEIINSPRIQELRQQSLDGRLDCFEGCEQIKYFCTHPISRPSSLESEVSAYRELQIEYGELCNVDCIMCWQDRDNRVALDFATLMQNLPIDPWKLVDVYGGEVFIMKDAWDHIRTLMSSGKRIVITTNGKALSDDSLARFVVENSAGINISINAVNETTHTKVMRPKIPFFNQVLSNVKNLRRIRESLGNKPFWINGHFVVVLESLYEWPFFIEKFDEMGFDSATIGFDHRHFPFYFEQNPQVVKELSVMVNQALQNIGNKTKRVTIADHGRFTVSSSTPS